MDAVLVIAALCATVYALVAGLSAMAAGSGASSLQWMGKRVAFQTLALLLVLLASVT